MKRLLTFSLLVAASITLNGCLDMLFRFNVNPNGSAGMHLAITMDRDMIEMFTNSTSDTDAHGRKKPLKLSKHTIDSIQDQMFKSDEMKTLRAKKYITNVTVISKQTDSSLTLGVDVGLTSYRYFDSVSTIMALLDSVKHVGSTDTTAPTQPTHVLFESGDSVKFIIPENSNNGSPALSDKSHRTDTSAVADSITAAMKGFEAMMAKMINVRFEFSAPHILSYDALGVLDRKNSTVGWDMTAADMSAGAGTARFVWFKKP
jgi:hypothetical protein